MTTAADRLTSSYYNANAYNAVTNPGGLGGDGHVINFNAMCSDIATVCAQLNTALQGVGALTDVPLSSSGLVKWNNDAGLARSAAGIVEVNQGVAGTLGLLKANGLRFPAAQVASADPNTLDDYEEGSFSPAITFGGLSTGVTYGASNGGRYIKVGRLVAAWGLLTLTSKGSATGASFLGGLPFAIDTSPGMAGNSAVISGVGALTLTNPLLATSYNTAGALELYELAANGTKTALTNSAFANNTNIGFSVVYPTT